MLLVVWLSVVASAIAQPYYFTRYQVEDGLSNNTVMCTIQDQKGLLWFGTKDGLNRFDGYTFKVFRNDPQNPNSIGSDFIRCIAEDLKGNLWVGTAKGIFRFNPKNESFTLLKTPSNEEIREIKIDQKGNIWFISGYTLMQYNDFTKKIKTYRHLLATSIANIISEDIWVSTAHGTLEKYQKATDSFTRFNIFKNVKSLAYKWIEKIYDTGKGKLLIGTTNQGVKIFDIKTSTYINLLTYNSDKTEIFVRDFIHESGNNYWIATESGIYIYNLKSGNILNLQKQYNNPYSISDNAIYTLCKDKEGGLWVGTYFGGVNYYPRQYAPFEKFFPKVGENSISGNAVREIIQDKYSDIWIGTEDAGLNRLNLKTGEFNSYKPTGLPTDISASNIHGIFATGDTLWIGTFEHGLNLMNIKTGKVIKKYTAGPGIHSFKTNFIHSIYQNRGGELLFSTTKGIYSYNRAHKNFDLKKEFPDHIFYTSILEDNNSTLWVGSYREGVFYYNRKTGKTGNYTYNQNNNHSLGNNRVNQIFQDSSGSLWFATEGGLCKLLKDGQTFKRYTRTEGFPSNIIFSILEENKSSLWISTSRGLVQFNPQTEEIKVYTKANGLLSDQLNYNSAFKDSHGRMYFGSVKGLIRFNPSKFIKNTYTPPVYITGFQVNNTELEINKESSPLKTSLIFAKKIQLKYHQSSFSIDFAALSFTSPETIEYAFKMEGLDKEWTYLKTNRKAYFTELPPGKYTFRLRASNTSGIWNKQETELAIEILPPYWASNWAYFIYFLFFSLVIYLIFRTYHQRLKIKNKRRLEDLERLKEKEIYDAKIEFFTNVAHEIRTPLTLIKGPMEKIIKKVEEVPQVKNNLRIMEKNTERLLELTNQLLDFRKTETTGFSLNFVKADMCELIKDISVRFKPAAEQKKARIKIDIPANKIYAFIDIEATTKILSNLINNATKYAESKVYIQLASVSQDDKSFTVLIKNDGYLIPPEMKSKIFEPFFRIKETQGQSGTGLGLPLSRSLAELQKGSLTLKFNESQYNTFALTLPIYRKTEEKLVLQNHYTT